MLLRNEILEMNKLNPQQLGDIEADRLCEVLIEDSMKEFGFSYEVHDHKEKLLRKYKYIKNEGIQHLQKKARVDTMQADVDVSKGIKDMIQASGSSSSSSVQVKIENPKLHQLHQAKKVLVAAEPRLSKIGTEIRRMIIDLKSKGGAEGSSHPY